MDFREIAFGSREYELLLIIRGEVLRKPLGMALQPKDTASDASDYHLAAFERGKPIGCVLLKPLTGGAVQLRQMAVLEGYRGRNIGAQLVRFAEQFARNKKFIVIETRARKIVEGFYKKLGYASCAHEFEDEHTLKMAKSL